MLPTEPELERGCRGRLLTPEIPALSLSSDKSPGEVECRTHDAVGIDALVPVHAVHIS